VVCDECGGAISLKQGPRQSRLEGLRIFVRFNIEDDVSGGERVRRRFTTGGSRRDMINEVRVSRVFAYRRPTLQCETKQMFEVKKKFDSAVDKGN